MSVSAETPPTSFAMVDDTMEVTSDHDHDEVQEDIDIDIDLTAGQHDADDMLDDIEPANATGNVYQLQQGLDDTNDDLMVDDDAVSYVMDDAEVQSAENQELDQEAITTNDQTLEPLSDDPNIEIPVWSQAEGAGKSDRPSEVTEPLEQAGRSSEQNNLPPQSPQVIDSEVVNVLPPNGGSETDTSKALNNDDGHSAEYDGAIENMSAHDLKPAVQATTGLQGVRSTNLLSIDSPLKTQIPVSTIETPHLDCNKSSPTADISEHSGCASPRNNANLEEVSAETLSQQKTHAVVVHYDNKIFPLVRSSAEQSPDDFFFDDHSYTEVPLSELLREFRTILKDDFVGDEHDFEICMFVEELGLEIIENSIAHDINFSQLINLHKTLQENDGLDQLEPMVLLLSIRVRFAIRLKELIAGANAGRGLFELANRDGSEISDQTLQYDQTYEEEFAPEKEANVTDKDADTSKPIGLIGEAPDSTDHSHDTEARAPDKPDNRTQLLHNKVDDSTVSNMAHPTTTTTLVPLGTESKAAGEDDLIDYEDDEDDLDDNLATTKESRDTQTNSVEYEARNEELRRRSISLVADEQNSNGQPEEVRNVETGNTAETHEDDEERQRSSQYEQHEGTFEGAYEHEEHWEPDEYRGEEFSTLNAATLGSSEHAVKFTNDCLFTNLTKPEEAIIEGIAQYTEEGYNMPLNEEGPNIKHSDTGDANLADLLDDEYDFVEGQEHERAIPAETAEDFDPSNEHHQEGNILNPFEVADILKRDADTPKSSIISQAHDGPIDGNQTRLDSGGDGEDLGPVSAEPQDEIDYEDDDDDTTTFADEPSTPVTSTLINGSGKRSRIDEELEDTVEAKTKEAKRSRS